MKSSVCISLQTQAVALLLLAQIFHNSSFVILSPPPVVRKEQCGLFQLGMSLTLPPETSTKTRLTKEITDSTHRPDAGSHNRAVKALEDTRSHQKEVKALESEKMDVLDGDQDFRAPRLSLKSARLAKARSESRRQQRKGGMSHRATAVETNGDSLRHEEKMDHRVNGSSDSALKEKIDAAIERDFVLSAQLNARKMPIMASPNRAAFSSADDDGDAAVARYYQLLADTSAKGQNASVVYKFSALFGDKTLSVTGPDNMHHRQQDLSHRAFAVATEGKWTAYFIQFKTDHGVNVYYHNSLTQECTWEKPTRTFPEVWMDATSTLPIWLSRDGDWSLYASPPASIIAGESNFSPTPFYFYYNRHTGVSQWERPDTAFADQFYADRVVVHLPTEEATALSLEADNAESEESASRLDASLLTSDVTEELPELALAASNEEGALGSNTETITRQRPASRQPRSAWQTWVDWTEENKRREEAEKEARRRSNGWLGFFISVETVVQ
jgi:hypothetical protein